MLGCDDPADDPSHHVNCISRENKECARSHKHQRAVVDLSPELRALISRSIASVEHVEILLLLHRAIDRVWTPEEISVELRRAPKSVEGRLRDLTRSRLVEPGAGGYRYRHGNHDHTVDELEREYEQRRVRLIEAIFSGPIDSARTFADAFRLWGEDDDT